MRHSTDTVKGMSNNIIGTVNNAAGGNSAGGGGNHDFPAALPYAHWRALGNKRRLALDMVQFQQFLSAGTLCMREIPLHPRPVEDDPPYRPKTNGFVEISYGDTISLKLRPSGAPARTVYIRHYEELHSQWEHVANSLTACPRSYFRDVVIDKIELSRTIMDMLGTALSKKRIDTLTLSYNNLDYTSLTTSYLENTPHVGDLKVVGNPMQDATTALQFVTAISNNEHMKKLEMRECGLGGNDLLEAMLPYLHMLKSVDIGYNDITSNDVPCICSFIARNQPTVKLLNLSFSEFNDSDAIKFANALKKNSSIERLQLNGADMTEKGHAQIDAVAGKRTLPKLIVSMKNAGPARRTVPDAPKLLKYEHWRSLGYDRESSKALVKFQNNLNGWDKGRQSRQIFDIDIDAYK
eukprot:scaffold39046_cov228-Skeletonema_dohrnii-CCMP3373.AAC.3